MKYLFVAIGLLSLKSAWGQETLMPVHRDILIPDIYFQLGSTKYASVFPFLDNSTDEPDSVDALVYLGELMQSSNFGTVEVIPMIDMAEDPALLRLRAEKVRRAIIELGARPDQVLITHVSRFPPAIDSATIAGLATEAEREAARSANACVLLVFHPLQK